MRKRAWRKGAAVILAGAMVMTALPAAVFASADEVLVGIDADAVLEEAQVEDAGDTAYAVSENAAAGADDGQAADFTAAAEEEQALVSDTAEPDAAAEAPADTPAEVFAGEEGEELPAEEDLMLIDDAEPADAFDPGDDFYLEDEAGEGLAEMGAEEFDGAIEGEEEVLLPEEETEEAQEAAAELGAPSPAQLSALPMISDNMPAFSGGKYKTPADLKPLGGNIMYLHSDWYDDGYTHTYPVYISKSELMVLGDFKTIESIKFYQYKGNTGEYDESEATSELTADGKYYVLKLFTNDISYSGYTRLKYTVKYSGMTVVESGLFYIRDKGVCGYDATWEFDPLAKELIISGKGELYDYDIESAVYKKAYGEDISKVTIQKGITSLGKYFLWNCGGGQVSVSIPDTVTKIGRSAFNGCPVKQLVIPDSVTEVEEYAFSSEFLETIKLPANLTVIPDNLFNFAERLKSVAIPSKVTKIGAEAFRNCSSMTSVTLPPSLKEIGSQAFEYCSGLKQITIPESVMIIDEAAFADCDSLERVVLPGGLKEISNDVFYGCDRLKEVVISDGAEKINKRAFRKCVALEKVMIPASVKTIDPDAFKDCPAYMVIYTSKGSAAEAFAIANGYKVEYTEFADYEKTVLVKTDAANMPEAVFNKMELHATKAAEKFIKLKWTKVSGAAGYVVYGALQGEQFKRLTPSPLTNATYKATGLSKNKYYKFMVVAISGNAGAEKINAVSTTVIAATSGGKFRNTASVRLNRGNSKLKVNKKLKLKGTAVSNSSAGKKYKIFRKMMYESTDPAVATVTATGRIKAVGKGTCYVYAYAQDGTFKRIRVRVKLK